MSAAPVLTRPRLLFGGAVLVLAAVGVGYTAFAMNRPPAGERIPGSATPATDPGLYLRGSDGYVVVQSADAVAGAEQIGTGLNCFRFYASGDAAVCLTPHNGLKPMTTARILGSDLRVQKTFDFGGVPNRARVSPSGRMISWTVFVTGDDYAASDFSTRTGFYDREADFLVKSMEDIGLYIDGEFRQPPDVNYWGLSFAADDNTFYATVATGGTTYLVRGDLETWTARTIRSNAECPSLSPDETRIVFKKRVRDGADDPWRLYVLDLATMEETPLAEGRSVDDQAAWLDDGTVAYAVEGGVWAVPSDGTGSPRLVAAGASSPAMVRADAR